MEVKLIRVIRYLLVGLTTIIVAGPYPTQSFSQTKYDTCFTFHGRLQVGNGAPSYRIWIVGTKHMLGVKQNDGEVPDMPDTLAKLVHFDKYVFGDFEVCPFTKYRKGEMQRVRVLWASKIRVVNR